MRFFLATGRSDAKRRVVGQFQAGSLAVRLEFDRDRLAFGRRRVHAGKFQAKEFFLGTVEVNRAKPVDEFGVFERFDQQFASDALLTLVGNVDRHDLSFTRPWFRPLEAQRVRLVAGP